jgi:hypothetical protein
MSRIVRLTESDLARIVRRVINEQITTPIIDGGYSDDLRQYAAVFSQPTVVAGKDLPSSTGKPKKTATISFNGVRFGGDGKMVAKGSISLYGICGMEANPAFLSPQSSYSLFEGGSAYQFSKGGIVDRSVRKFCAQVGQPSSPNAGRVMPDLLASVKAAAAKVVR